MKPEERIVFFLPDYGIYRCLQFGYYKYSKAQSQLPIHQHVDVLEICFCITGKQHYAIEGESFMMYGNDILIVPPNKQHGTGDYPEEKGELFWLQIICVDKKHKLCNLSIHESEYLINELTINASKIFKGAFQTKFILEELLNQLKGKKSTLSKIIINQLIIQILLEVLNFSKKKQGSIPLQKLTTIDNYIMNNIYRMIYVDELADVSGFSVGYFKTWFKNRVGVPPREYVNRLKIEQAKVDLFKKNTITAVSYDLGFSSSQYFSTTFKKYTGYTPKSYIRLKNG